MCWGLYEKSLSHLLRGLHLEILYFVWIQVFAKSTNRLKSLNMRLWQYLFYSVQSVTIMKCGHTLHYNCLLEMISQDQYAPVYLVFSYALFLTRQKVVCCFKLYWTLSRYRCPICSKSVVNMSTAWKRLEEEVCSFLFLSFFLFPVGYIMLI